MVALAGGVNYNITVTTNGTINVNNASGVSLACKWFLNTQMTD